MVSKLPVILCGWQGWGWKPYLVVIIGMVFLRPVITGGKWDYWEELTWCPREFLVEMVKMSLSTQMFDPHLLVSWYMMQLYHHILFAKKSYIVICSLTRALIYNLKHVYIYDILNARFLCMHSISLKLFMYLFYIFRIINWFAFTFELFYYFFSHNFEP